jgi:hypothetical protein
MNFNQETTGAGGQRGQSHGWHVIAAAGPVAGIYQDRQMAKRSGRRNNRKVERVAAMIGKRPDPALAESRAPLPVRLFPWIRLIEEVGLDDGVLVSPMKDRRGRAGHGWDEPIPLAGDRALGLLLPFDVPHEVP